MYISNLKFTFIERYLCLLGIMACKFVKLSNPSSYSKQKYSDKEQNH